MHLRPNVNFAGNAGDALAHYRDALGGEADVALYADGPAEMCPSPQWAQKIMYAKLRTPFGEIDLMDAPPGRESQVGGNVSIALDVDDEARGAEIFAKLADGGAVLMPFETTFFARKFGMTNDRFGVRWLVSVAPVVVARA